MSLVDSLWELIARFANLWTVIILWVIVIAYYFIFFYGKDYGAKTFDSRVSVFRPSEVESILGTFDPEKLPAYRSQAATVDMFFPVLYSIAAAALIVHCSPHLRFRWLVLLPFAMALFDWLENISVITIIGRYGKSSLGNWPTMLVIAQRLKFLFMGATLVIMAIALGGCLWRTFRR